MLTNSMEAGLSILDLLIDDDPQSSKDPPLSPTEREQRIREGVEHDIGHLLNSRHWLGAWAPELELLRYSLLNYGLPDMTGVAIDSKPVQTVINQTVRMALEVYEPRLSNLKVTIASGYGERSARMIITGDLRGVPGPFNFRRSVRHRPTAGAAPA